MAERFIIDRFEAGFAVCESENRDMINIDISKLPHGILEGCVITLDEYGVYSIKDDDEENNRQERIRNKMDRLWKN